MQKLSQILKEVENDQYLEQSVVAGDRIKNLLLSVYKKNKDGVSGYTLQLLPFILGKLFS